MARVHTTKANGQAQRKCGRCGHEIQKGETYYWAKPGFRTRRPVVRCSKHPFRPSELTTGIRSEALAAKEEWDDALDGIWNFEELESAHQDLLSALEDYVSTRQEALDAWPNGNSQLEGLLSQAEAARDEVASWSCDYSGLDEPDDDDLQVLHEEAGDEPHSRDDLVEMWLEKKIEEAKSELDDIVQGLDL